ncbi:hypothetical protein [Akkermansia glycaniphila]|uniref:Uncharacterized protein n=1 Tax=Akkermansia glycaniphila TaxID=1679444 RepID=A0A1C7PAT3_9BACT|nr:hypothetical protein [Akkermansia glycaniphila]MBT9450072.1 hypothetical protein [Akkermansia glycaniphila]OCA02700.1 hypothetical protein AC781_09525 [Akkermansia glycaniphila]SEH77074.1 Hypothetical protein PYTT_0615 [Akkermansia glycaniphila]
MASRKSKYAPLDELDLRQQQIDKELADLRAFVQGAPTRIQEMENTLSAPEDILTKRQTRRIKCAVDKGHVYNTRRELKENTLLLLLLVASIIASLCWLLNLLNQA